MRSVSGSAMTLPTRADIAALIEKHVIGHFQGAGDSPYAPSALASADALLARLRPGCPIKNHEGIACESCLGEWRAEAQRLEQEYEAEKDHIAGWKIEVDALRADLRACAEALAGIEEHLGHLDANGPVRKSIRAALARPGVQAALTPASVSPPSP